MEFDVTLLKGKFVYLEKLTPEHLPVLKELARDERIWEYTKTLLINETFDSQADSYLSTALDRNAFGGQQAFIIRQATNNEIIGMTRLYGIEPKDKRVSIGYTWYIPPVWGNVHNKECKLLLLRYVFEIWGFNRVEFYVAGQNIRSQKAVQKIGGIKEGILRNHGYRPDGSLRDTVIFSILKEEWPGVKERLIEMIREANIE
jgi:N-acetyltransferase